KQRLRWRGGSARCFMSEVAFDPRGARNEGLGKIGAGEVENPTEIGGIDGSDFDAQPGFLGRNPTNNAPALYASLVVARIEEEIHGPFPELKSGINAKAAASKSDEAAGESCGE